MTRLCYRHPAPGARYPAGTGVFPWPPCLDRLRGQPGGYQEGIDRGLYYSEKYCEGGRSKDVEKGGADSMFGGG